MYSDLANLDSEKRLTEHEIERSIIDFGTKVTIPPHNDHPEITVYKTNDPNVVNIDFDLWIDNQKSDLTLSANLKNENGRILFAKEISMCYRRP